MASVEEIRLLTIKAVTEGVDKATADLNKLSEAQGNLGVVSDTTTKASVSVTTALSRQQMQLDTNYRAQTQFNKSQLDITRGYNEGMISLDRYNQLSALNTERLNNATGAHSKLQSAMSGVQGQLVAMAAGAGPVGVFLAALGPWGVAAAIGLTAVEGIFSHMAAEARRLGEEARGIKDFGDNVNLTAVQIQALTAAAADVGVPAETLRTGIERLSSNMMELSLGTGKALEQITRINPALADQLMRTRDTATQINLIAQAWEHADTAQRNALSRSTMGRNLSLGMVLGQVAEAGGIDPLTNQMADRIALTNQQTDLFAKQQTQIDALKKHAMDLMASLWTEEVQQAQRTEADLMDRMANRMKEMKDAASGGWWQDFWVKVGQAAGGQQMVGAMPQPGERNLQAGLPPENLRQVGVNRLMQIPSEFASGNVPMPMARPAQTAVDDGLTSQAVLAKSKAQISILGEAATQTEIFKNKQLELADAAQKARVSQEYVNRATAAYTVAQYQANEAAKQSLGVASESEIEKSRMIALDLQVAKGLQLTNEQHNLAVAIIQKEAKAQAEANQVRASALPGLTQMGLDAGNLNKQLDTVATGGLNSMNTSLLDFETGVKSGGDAMKAFESQFIRSLLNMINQMFIMQPIAAALQATLKGTGGGLNLLSFLGIGGGSAPSISGSVSGGVGVVSAMGNVFDQGRMIHPYALGGIMSDIITRPTLFPMANGAGLAGEAGPEAIMPLKRGSDGRLGVAGGSGGGSPVNIHMGDVHIDASGADPAVVARLQTALAQDRKQRYSDVVKIVQDASNRGMRLHS
jgi:lambda family phage tail tape measure protein